MAGKKIGELTPLGRNLIATDELELSLAGSAGSRKITGAEIIGAAGGVTSVTGTSPIVSSGGSTPAISINVANASQNGYLSSIDWSTFNAKQVALVSGTNIKTINGSSILGGGDLVVGGSGLKGVHNLIGGNPTSLWGTMAGINCVATTFTSQSANNITLYPFIPNKTITSVSLRIQVGTGVVGGIARILVYSDLNGFPNTKLYESANLDCSTSGTKTAITSFTFTAGEVYWLACHTGASIQMVSIPVTNLIPIGFQNVGAGVTSFSSLSVPIGSAPNPYVFQYVNGSAVTAIYISAN